MMIGFEKTYDWFVNVLCFLTVLFTFQFTVPSVSASPIIFESDLHTGISETYTYDEIENSGCIEVGLTDGLSRVLSGKGVRPDHKVLVEVAGVAAKGGFDAICAFKNAISPLKGGKCR